MVEALTLHALQSEIQERYEHDEQRVVGIMLARYDIGVTSEIVEQCYQYWHLNSRKFLIYFGQDMEHIYLLLMSRQLKLCLIIEEIKIEHISI